MCAHLNGKHAGRSGELEQPSNLSRRVQDNEPSAAPHEPSMRDEDHTQAGAPHENDAAHVELQDGRLVELPERGLELGDRDLVNLVRRKKCRAHGLNHRWQGIATLGC